MSVIIVFGLFLLFVDVLLGVASGKDVATWLNIHRFIAGIVLAAPFYAATWLFGFASRECAKVVSLIMHLADAERFNG